MLALLIKRYKKNFDFDDIKSILSHNYNTILSIHLEKNVEITLRYISY